MQRYDLAPFEALMQELAEVYDRKPYGTAAIKHWFEALEFYPWEKVKAKLLVWRDYKPKAPVIAELVAILREGSIDEREAKAKADKLAFLREPTPVTEYGRECMAQTRRLVSSPRKPGRWWAYELRDMHHSGRVLSHTQIELAKRVCGSDWEKETPIDVQHRRERTPGEDDE